MTELEERAYYAICPECGEIVYADQAKRRDADGVYHHRRCHTPVIIGEEANIKQIDIRKEIMGFELEDTVEKEIGK